MSEKLCFHKSSEKEVMMGQKTGDYMCTDGCLTPINSTPHQRPTEADWTDARLHAVKTAFQSIFADASSAEVAEVTNVYLHPQKVDYLWEGTVMAFRFEEYQRRAEAIAKEALRIGWKAEVKPGGLIGDPRKILKIRIEEA